MHKLNRPAHELTRAINAELTSGLLCIPESMRETKLYSTLRDRRAIAAMKRHDKIVENGERMNRKWKLSIPEWNEFEVIHDDDDVIDEIVETVSEVVEDLSLGSMTSAVDTAVEGAEEIVEKFTESIKEKLVDTD